MPCLYPNYLIRGRRGGLSFQGQVPRNEKVRQDFRRKIGYQEVPCGQCLQCRFYGAVTWGIRCQHELQMHRDPGIFLTLTFNDENLPKNGSIFMDDVSDFVRELRRRLGVKIRYFGAGEYGDDKGRPHYHLLVFGVPDLERIRVPSKSYFPLFSSPLIDDIWQRGFAPFGSITFESAAYTARYAIKKINGEKKKSYYRRVDPETGEIFEIEQEASRQSTMPGIGHDWLLENWDEVWRNDSVICNGHEIAVPRYYDKILQKRDPDLYLEVKEKRLRRRAERPILTMDQLADLKRATQSRFNNLMRCIE